MGMTAGDWFCFAKRNDVALPSVGLPPLGTDGAFSKLALVRDGNVEWLKYSP
jgi:hypothetical protein